jgi:hypothetical protein
VRLFLRGLFLRLGFRLGVGIGLRLGGGGAGTGAAGGMLLGAV